MIDKTTQKAFISKVNGVIEHNQVLHEIIDHAKCNRLTAHLTFFDLEDAFGSVQHDLISYSLKRYRIPTAVHDYIMNLYSMLCGTVVTKEWSSHPFKFNKGVFQGDPLSPIIFLTVFNPLLEKLKLESHHGYKINNTAYITTPFADDFNLITRNKRTHQNLIKKLHCWSSSMGLKLKPSKCKSISIVSGKPTSISFLMGDDILDTLEKEPHKFLGSTITFSNKQCDILESVKSFLLTRLDRIDALLVRNEYKIKIFRNYLLPAARFTLTVHSLSATSLNKLDSETHKYLKRWLGLPNCATTAAIHSSKFLDVKSISHLYQKCQANAYVTSRSKADSKVQNALDSKLEREKT